MTESTEIATFKSAILSEIDGAIYFREGTASRFPEDTRNEQCVESLRALHQNIDNLPGDDSTLHNCLDVYRGKHQAAGNSDAIDDTLWFPTSEDLAMIGSASKPVFTRYGFDAKESGDAREFLAGLSSEIEGWEPDELRLDE